MERTRYPVSPLRNSAAAYRQFFGQDSRVAGRGDAWRVQRLGATIAQALLRYRTRKSR